MSRTPLIAIVGKPNVGKSTLFNRFIGERRAVVEDMPGVTRDRNYAFTDAYDIPFGVVDTGGFVFDSDEEDAEMQEMVQEQTRLAIEEADVVLVLFDGNTGVQSADQQVVDLLRRAGHPVVYAVNKCDGKEQAGKMADFYSLGLPQLVDVSALHGHGVLGLVGELLNHIPDIKQLKAARALEEAALEDEIRDAQSEVDQAIEIPEPIYAVEEPDMPPASEERPRPAPVFAPVYLPEDNELSELEYDRRYKTAPIVAAERVEEPDSENEAEEPVLVIDNIRVAIVGRPNAGKSSLLNVLVGKKRAVTSSIAGTTRDNVDAEVTRDGQKFTIVDTAGLRKKGKVANNVERYSTMRALRALSDCDVVVVVIDAVRGVSEQDAKIVGLAHDQGRGVVIAINKWDAVEKSQHTVTEYSKNIRDAFKFAPYAPLVYTCALNGRRCERVLEAALEVARERQRRIPTRRLNTVLRRALLRRSLPVYRGHPVKIYYAAQVAVAPPRFCLFVNYPKGIHFSNLRFLKNAIRDEFGFAGSDIKLMTRKRGESTQ